MARHQLRDPALHWLYKQMQKEQANMPEDQRVGFDAWLRQYGILNPTSGEAIARFEVASLDAYMDREYDGE